jgi:hypothetical protein
MISNYPSVELKNFHDFIASKIAAGEVALSPEEALDQWRGEHPSTDLFAQDVAAVLEALTDMEAGDQGVPLDEFDQRFRQRHGLSPNP